MSKKNKKKNTANKKGKEKSPAKNVDKEVVNNTDANEEVINTSDNKINSNDSSSDTGSVEPAMPEPKKVERKIKHPKTDVVRFDFPELDDNWGWALEFPTSEQLEPIWSKLKDYLEKNENHPLKGKVSWLTMDPRGYFSPRLRHFIAFTGWGVQIETLPDWFKKNISAVKKPIKEIEASEELADGNWQGYIVKEKIDLNGPEVVKLDSFSRNKRKTVEEAKKPLSSNIPRYWAQESLFNGRDYLIPVITEGKFTNNEFDSVSYLEEYVVEQLDWKEDEKHKDAFVILPTEFTFDENAKRHIHIPEEYTPEFEFDPSMFGGMGGLGGFPGMDGMGDMPDFGDMPDLDDSELDKDLEDSEDSEDPEVEKKDEAIDAEIVSDEK